MAALTFVKMLAPRISTLSSGNIGYFVFHWTKILLSRNSDDPKGDSGILLPSAQIAFKKVVDTNFDLDPKDDIDLDFRLKL